jgi:anti-sigma B factor antagonist
MLNQCTIDVERIDDACVVRLRGEVDLSNASEIEQRLVDAGRNTHALVVDLGEVGYMDSSGFGMLERLAHHVALRVVVPPTAVVYRALAVTGLEQLVAVFPTVPAALAT